MLAKGHWDYFQVVFMELHCAGHHLWHINDPGHPRYSKQYEEALGEPLRAMYREMDAFVGALLAMVDDSTLAVFYASHGMGPQYTGTGLLDRILHNIERGVRRKVSGKTLKGRARSVWRSIPPDLRAKINPVKKHLGAPLIHEHWKDNLFVEFSENGAIEKAAEAADIKVTREIRTASSVRSAGDSYSANRPASSTSSGFAGNCSVPARTCVRRSTMIFSSVNGRSTTRSLSPSTRFTSLAARGG